MPISRSMRRPISRRIRAPASARGPDGAIVSRKGRSSSKFMAEVVDGAPGDAELQARGAQAGTAAVRADVLHHHPVQPPGLRPAAKPDEAAGTLDDPGNALC